MSGTAEAKTAQEIRLAQQMGGSAAGINPAQFKALQEALKANGGMGMGGMGGDAGGEEDEEGLPELEGDFEGAT